MPKKLTKNGNYRGRKPKGADEEIQAMPPMPRGSGMKTIDIIEAVLSETRKDYKASVDATGLTAQEFERKVAAVARKRQLDRKKIRGH